MKYISYDHFFTVLANGQRVKILQYLNQEGPKSVSDISIKLKIEQSAVSHCMRHLLRCHFVEVNQQGKERIYAINNDTMQPLFNLINKHVKTYCVEGCQHWE
jgi:DNA-binding transcriptional ArsR family regulator